MRRAMAAGAIAMAATAAMITLGFLEPIDRWAYDTAFSLRGSVSTPPSIVLVSTDDQSFAALKVMWPLPRAMHGEVLDRLSAAQPAAIGIDVLFPEPSARGDADDEAFAASVARAGNVVLAAALTQVSEGFYTKLDLNLPVPPLKRAAAAVGAVNTSPGDDGVVREATLSVGFDDLRLPAFAVALYDVAGRHGMARARKPLPNVDEFGINFLGGSGSFRRLAYQDVLRGRFPENIVRGAIVLVGTTASSGHDFARTPTAKKKPMPGLEINAHILETLLTGRYVRVVPKWTSLLAGTLAALGAATLVRSRHVRGLIDDAPKPHLG